MMVTKTVHVLYFAQFREQRGLSEEHVSTECRTAGDLYRELADLHGLSYDPATHTVAVAETVAGWDTAIRDGDTVVFLAPFGGG
jgi:molybdopterin converting factor small subunit